MEISEEAIKRYGQKVIRVPGVDGGGPAAAPGDIDSQPELRILIYIHTYVHTEGINRSDVNTVRRSSQCAEPRSSDPIQRHRAATRKFRLVPRVYNCGSSEELEEEDHPPKSGGRVAVLY